MKTLLTIAAATILAASTAVSADWGNNNNNWNNDWNNNWRNDGYGSGEGNEGCAMPIAQFDVINPVTGEVELVDPRMLMPIHEAFIQ